MAASEASSRFQSGHRACPQQPTFRRPRTILAGLLAGLCAAAVPAPPVSAGPPPVVGSVSPRSSLDSGGGAATVNGSGFTGATAVKFGGVAASNIQVASDSQLTANIPAHNAQVVHVQVTAAGGTSQPGAGDRFTYYKDLAGALSGTPDAASWGGGRVDAFARGSDGALKHRWRQDGQWSAWDSLGGGIAFGQDQGVGAVAWGPNRIDVFVRGQDNALWHKWWSGAAWSGWFSLGGNLTSGPDAASWAPGRLDVFARGVDNGLWHRWWDGAQWKGWEALGGSLTAGPGTVSWGPNRIDVFARGNAIGLWHAWWDGAGWNGWESFFVDVSGRPEPATLGVGQLDVFDWTPDGTIYGFAYTGVWHPQRPLYLSGYGGPGAVASGPGASDLFETSYPNWTLLYTTTTPN
jgi:IPT/TIG domain-containing protein